MTRRWLWPLLQLLWRACRMGRLIFISLTFGLLAGMFILWSVLGAGAPLTGAVFGLLIVLTLPHMAIVEHWQQS